MGRGLTIARAGADHEVPPWHSQAGVLGQDFLTRLLESSPDCIKLLDVNARLLFMSAGGLCAMEIDDFQPFLGRYWIDFWDGTDRKAALEAVEEAKAGRISRFQGFCPTAKGTPKWWDVTVTPMSGANGQPGQLLAISRDATALRTAEAELRTSAEQNRRQAVLFDTAINKMKQGLCFFDGNECLVVANRRYAEIYGLTLDQMRPGTSLREIVERRYAAGSGPDMPKAEYLSWRDEIAGSLVPTDTTVRLRNGRTIAIHHEPMPDGGWVSTHDDITEFEAAKQRLQADERRYRAIAEASSAIFWRADANGSVVDSDGWETFTGQSASADHGTGWLAAVHPEDQERVLAISGESARTGKSLAMEYRLRHVSGEYRWVVGRGVPVRAQDGTVEEWVGTVTDQHERKRAEEAVRRAEERLRLATQVTGLGIWDVDLRTGERRWSGELRAILGLSDDVAESRDVFEARIDPRDRAEAVEVYSAFLNGGGDYRAEYRILRADDGAERWVGVLGQIYFDAAGRPRRAIGTMKDITESRIAAEALRQAEERLRLAVGTTGLGIWDIDLRSGSREWSSRMREMLGVTADARIGPETFLDRVHPADRSRFLDHTKRVRFTTGRSVDHEFRIVRADNGDVRWMETCGRTLLGEDGQASRRIGIIQDITARKQSEAALRDSEERLMLALRAGRMYAWDRDLTTGFVMRSENAKELIGLGSGSYSEFAARIHPEDREGVRLLEHALWGSNSDQSEVRYIRPDGQTIWLAARSVRMEERGQPNRVVGITFDITEKKAAEQAVWRVAHHDPLTGLPNRRLLQNRFEQALANAEAKGTKVGLLLIDLDDFKDVNDTLGHDAGDAILKQTADRLAAMVRDCDTVARLGGDEFAVIVSEPPAPDHMAALAQSIVRTLQEPFSYQGSALASRASVGVAIYPDHDRLPHELLKDADMALYRAKAGGRNRVVTYAPTLRSETEQRVFLAREMHEALRQGQILPFYQPKVCFTTGKIVGFEALARWRHPSRGVLTPGVFGAAFEDPELARAIGEQVVRRVTTDMRDWLDRGLEIGRVAVNLSAAEFAQPRLAENMLEALTAAGVPTQHFEVEVTETVFLGKSSEAAPEVLKRFSEAGLTVTLDDFGTGFASLSHLKHFPVDHIKIDQTFVRDLEQDADDAAIVTAVIGLGKSLKLSVTAEGVETVGQAERLRELGCDYAQGYLYAKPMVGSRVPRFLTNWCCEQSTGEEPRRLRAP